VTIKLNLHKNYNYCYGFPLKTIFYKHVGRIMFKKLIKTMASQPVQSYMQQAFPINWLYLASFIQQHMSTQKNAFPSGSPVHSDPPTLINSTWQGIKQKNRPWDHVQHKKMILQFQKKDQDEPQVMNYTQNYSKKIYIPHSSVIQALLMRHSHPFLRRLR
jgi:hypothetical protein